MFMRKKSREFNPLEFILLIVVWFILALSYAVWKDYMMAVSIFFFIATFAIRQLSPVIRRRADSLRKWIRVFKWLHFLTGIGLLLLQATVKSISPCSQAARILILLLGIWNLVSPNKSQPEQ